MRVPDPVLSPADAFLRFAHEEFYTEPPFAIDQCEFTLTERLFVDEVITTYVNSYVIQAQCFNVSSNRKSRRRSSSSSGTEPDTN